MENKVKLTKLEQAFTNHILVCELIKQAINGTITVPAIAVDVLDTLHGLGYRVKIK